MSDWSDSPNFFTPEQLPEFPSRDVRAILEDMVSLLSDINLQLQHLNSAERTGAVSSVEVKWTAATKDRESTPAPVVKMYAGSEPPVEDAVLYFAQTVLRMEQMQIQGLHATVEALRNGEALK